MVNELAHVCYIMLLIFSPGCGLSFFPPHFLFRGENHRLYTPKCTASLHFYVLRTYFFMMWSPLPSMVFFFFFCQKFPCLPIGKQFFKILLGRARIWLWQNGARSLKVGVTGTWYRNRNTKPRTTPCLPPNCKSHRRNAGLTQSSKMIPKAMLPCWDLPCILFLVHGHQAWRRARTGSVGAVPDISLSRTHALGRAGTPGDSVTGLDVPCGEL